MAVLDTIDGSTQIMDLGKKIRDVLKESIDATGESANSTPSAADKEKMQANMRAWLEANNLSDFASWEANMGDLPPNCLIGAMLLSMILLVFKTRLGNGSIGASAYDGWESIDLGAPAAEN